MAALASRGGMKMHLGAATYSYLWRCDVREAIRSIARQGIKHIELMPTPPHIWPRAWSKAERAALRDFVADLGVGIHSVNPTYVDLNVISTNPALRAESLQQMEELIEFAGQVGAKLLIFIPGRLHALIPMPREMAWQAAQAAVRHCLPAAIRHGVILGIENVPFGLLRTAAEVMDFARQFPAEHVRVVYDVANANVVEDPATGIRAVAERLALAHLADNGGKAWAHLAIGDGSIDFAAVLAALHEVGYNGVYMTEMIEPGDPDSDLEVSIARLAAWSG